MWPGVDSPTIHAAAAAHMEGSCVKGVVGWVKRYLGGWLSVAGGPPWLVFCDELVMAVHFWMTPQPLGSCEAVAAYM